MGEFRMPSLGADMEEGTLVEWLVHPGDAVHRGDVVAVVDTAKSAIEVEVFEDGVVEQLLVQPGTTVPVGAPLAVLADGGTGPGAAEPAAVAALVPDQPEVPAVAEAPEPTHHTQASPVVRHLAHEQGVDLDRVAGSGPDGRVTRADVLAAGTAPAGAGFVRATPRARRLAAERGLDLAGVRGTGPDGAVTAEDLVPAGPAAAAPVGAPLPEQVPERVPEPVREPAPRPAAPDKRTAMREAIAALMARSKREIPHYYLQSTVDLARATAWVRAANEGRPVAERIVLAAVLLKASALAVRRVPEVNGFHLDGRFQPSEHVHLGVAVALRGGGLVAPAIHDAEVLPLPELMAALKDLVARARAGRLRGSEMSDPTLTVTNLGEQGAELVHGVIYPPQVALVGFGRVVERPWAVDGMLAVRPVLTVTLAADHRVTDGHRGGLYLNAIDDLLQKPEEL